jgi:hypothetical protein
MLYDMDDNVECAEVAQNRSSVNLSRIRSPSDKERTADLRDAVVRPTDPVKLGLV